MNVADVFSAQKRSQIMSRIRGYDTKPELIVRSIVHRMGYRFRLHLEDLPGNPDIVLPRHNKVIFIHGCFWHGHRGCQRSKRPATNVVFWQEKLDKNIQRDKRQQKELRKLGWKYLVIWQCEMNRPNRIRKKIKRFLDK
jgi:DNA mismatch endonuclease (patch repair protein)